VVEKGQFSGDTQAQAEVLLVAAGPVRLVEAVEDIRLHVVGDAASLIFHLEQELPWTGTGADTDGTSGRGVGTGIVQEDQKKLPDPLRICGDQRERLRGKIQTEGDGPLPAERPKPFIQVDEKGIHIHGLRAQSPALGIRGCEKQHIVYKTGHTDTFAVYKRQQCVFFFWVIPESVCGGSEDGKGRTEFMGSGGDEPGLFFLAFFHRL
jgi:hypothetical protein